MADFTTVFASGTIYWCKVLGNPVNNYEGDAREWTYDFVPDDTGFLKEHGLTDRLKEDKNGNMNGPFLHLKKPELNRDGEVNEHIRVYNADDEEWDREVSIGNGSKVDVKLTIADWGKGKRKSIWTRAIRVTEHVPYVSNEFSGMGGNTTEDTSPKKAPRKTAGKKQPDPSFDDLDDDIPF